MRIVLLAISMITAHTASAAQPAIGIEVSSRSLRPGELVVVILSLAAEASDVRVSLFDKDVSAFHDRGDVWRALVGIDLEQAPGAYKVVATARLGDVSLRGSKSLVVNARTFTTRTLRVAPDFVDPPAAVRERIARESASVSEAYAASASERLWSGAFVRPVADKANSRFGQHSVFNGTPRGRHTGTDFLSPAGRPIKAPNAGRVVLADDLFMSGKTVIIDHGLQIFSLLAHMSAINVKEGDVLTAGQVVGLVGATGRVTGAHLHWAMRVAGARVDPLSALALLGARQPLIADAAPPPRRPK
jgi:murein DD-endopeptidase MepM/ murein hydrolase activator NlpD